jgi:hypothetical protein
MGQRSLAHRLDSPEELKTIEILALHERVFAPLDPRAKRRIAQNASMNGWDRTWDDPPYA